MAQTPGYAGEGPREWPKRRPIIERDVDAFVPKASRRAYSRYIQDEERQMLESAREERRESKRGEAGETRAFAAHQLMQSAAERAMIARRRRERLRTRGKRR